MIRFHVERHADTVEVAPLHAPTYRTIKPIIIIIKSSFLMTQFVLNISNVSVIALFFQRKMEKM